MNNQVAEQTNGIFGAIIGDIVGSRFERHNIKSKEFELFDAMECRFTDDTVLTLAIADAVLNCAQSGGGGFLLYSGGLPKMACRALKHYGRTYPRAGYGKSFRAWLASPDAAPYNSYGNGAAMRVSPVAYAARSLEEAEKLAAQVTSVTHNHPEGLKGARATAAAIYMALNKRSKEEIKTYIETNYYTLDFTLDEIRPTYRFNSSCQGSVPQALQAFFESADFEDAIRSAISIGGDSDTIAAIAGSIAGAYYGVPDEMKRAAEAYLDTNLLSILRSFNQMFAK